MTGAAELVSTIAQGGPADDPDFDWRIVYELHASHGQSVAESVMMRYIHDRAPGWQRILSALPHLGGYANGYSPETLEKLLEIAGDTGQDQVVRKNALDGLYWVSHVRLTQHEIERLLDSARMIAFEPIWSRQTLEMIARATPDLQQRKAALAALARGDIILPLDCVVALFDDERVQKEMHQLGFSRSDACMLRDFFSWTALRPESTAFLQEETGGLRWSPINLKGRTIDNVIVNAGWLCENGKLHLKELSVHL